MPTGDTSKLKDGIRTNGQRDRAGSLHTPSPLNLGRNGQGSSNLLQYMIASKETESPLPSCKWDGLDAGLRLSFVSIHSSIVCIRGSHSSLHKPVYTDNITYVSQERRVPPEYVIMQSNYDTSFVYFLIFNF